MQSAEQGEQFVCAKVKGWLYSGEQHVSAGIPQLTATEKEILRSLALGKSTKEIAAERFLSVYTIMTHRKNIFRKLNKRFLDSETHVQCNDVKRSTG